MLFQFKVILYSATCYKGKLHTSLPRSSSPENSLYIYTHLYAHNHLVKKEEAAKICVLSGLVVQFFFLIFYFVFDRRFLDML